MSNIQKQALRAMADKNIGAVITKYGWTWPCHVRENIEVASAVLEVLR